MADHIVGDTLYILFTTRAFATGIPTVLTGSQVVSAYENDSATQITAGITLGVDHDGVVGLNLLTIVATGANGYDKDKDYSMVITTGTVDSVSVVGEVVGNFSLRGSNVTAISDDATAANNLEAQYDATGLTGGAFPATQDQVGAIGTAGGAGQPFAPADDNVDGALNGVTFVGVQTSGTFASLAAEQGTYHVIDDDTNNIDIVYQFNLGGNRTGFEIIWKGYLAGAGDSVNIQAYDFIGAAWETLAVITGKNQAVNETKNIVLLSKHTGTGANVGIVYVRKVVASATNPTLNGDQLIVEAVGTGAVTGFANGAVWVDTTDGVAGTATGIGHADNPSSNLTDALTIATANKLKKFSVNPNSTITLGASFTNKEMEGHEWVLDLSGEDIGGSEFVGATVSGIGTGTGTTKFRDCIMNATTIPPGTHLINCDQDGTITFGAAGTFTLDNCAHGSPAPAIIDFGSGLNASTLHMHPYHGALEIQNMGAGTGTYVLHINGDGSITFNANCSATSTINISGNWAKTNNASGLTINEVARFDNVTGDAILVDTGELQTDWTDGGRLDLLLDLVSTTADLLDKLGAVDEAAAVGDPSSTESVMQYVKQIIDVLMGATGIVSMPAAAAPANNVSIAEMVRAIYDDTNSLEGTKIPDTLSLANIKTQVDSGFTTQMADSVPADGTIPTREQMIYMVGQFLMDFAISSTTRTTRKVDGSTTLITHTLDDDTLPTSLTRAT